MFAHKTHRDTWMDQWGPEPVHGLYDTARTDRVAPISLPDVGGVPLRPGVAQGRGGAAGPRGPRLN